MRSLILFLSFVCACYCTVPSLDVGWNSDPDNPKPFNSLPKTVDDALKQGYRKTRECTANPKFAGIAYIKNNEFSIVLLFSVNGEIAGVQFSVTKLAEKKAIIPPRPFVRSEGRVYVTFYFMDPAIARCSLLSIVDFSALFSGEEAQPITALIQSPFTTCFVGGLDLYVTSQYWVLATTPVQSDFKLKRTICSPGPKSIGNEYKLLLQINDSPKSAISIALKENGLDLKQWRMGVCLPRLGRHYWLIVVDRCDIRLPVFLIFDKGEIVGFGFGVIMQPPFIGSHNFGQEILNLFLGITPTCMKEPRIIEIVYVFLRPRPLLSLCQI